VVRCCIIHAGVRSVDSAYCWSYLAFTHSVLAQVFLIPGALLTLGSGAVFSNAVGPKLVGLSVASNVMLYVVCLPCRVFLLGAWWFL
jgi:hypothetical protein